MGYGISLLVKGDFACFTRPEMKVERVSYDVITPSAARGVIEAIHWKPAIKWVIDRIHVLNEIKFKTIKRNEIRNKIGNISDAVLNGGPALLYQDITAEREQRSSLILKDVAYIIDAHFELTEDAGERDTVEKHYAIFCERARNGRCFYQPYLGNREFSAYFELIEGGKEVPKSYYSNEEKDLGWMLHDIDFKNNMTPKFFRAIMNDGIIEIPKFD